MLPPTAKGATLVEVAKRLKRKRATVTFSVSVEPKTKELLRKIADEAYQGNVSELISQIAEQAARRAAAGELLRLHGRKPMSDAELGAFEHEIEAELAAEASRKKRRRVA